MMTPKQKWTIAGLVPVCLAVWVPQFLNGKSTSGQVSVNGPTEAEIMEAEMMPGVSGPGAAPKRSTPKERQGKSPNSASGSDEGAGNGALGESGGDRSRGLLIADVLKTLGASEAFRVPGSRSDAVVHGMDPAEARDEIEEIDSGPELVSPMVSFVESHPLRGTMAGATKRFAVFGSHRVSEGELLPGTGALVAEIRRTGVRIEEAGMSLEVTLPPLQTRPAQAPSEESVSGAPARADPQTTLDNIATVSAPEALPSGQ